MCVAIILMNMFQVHVRYSAGIVGLYKPHGSTEQRDNTAFFCLLLQLHQPGRGGGGGK